MKDMFYLCNNLTSLDASNWDTSNVTDMSGLFSHCASLTEVDIRNFDTSNVTDMHDMFSYCDSLHTIRLDNCTKETISKIINSEPFSTDYYTGNMPRRIYCKRANAAGLTAPENWQFSYID
jgi:surface protein